MNEPENSIRISHQPLIRQGLVGISAEGLGVDAKPGHDRRPRRKSFHHGFYAMGFTIQKLTGATMWAPQ